MKVLVTGAHGLVGSQIAGALAKKSVEVLSPNRQDLNLLEPASVKTYLEKNRPELLIHSAWYTVHGKFWSAPENEEWLQASLFLAKQFEQSGGRRFFGLGTCAEYEWVDSTVCDEEKTPLKPATLYGQKKLQFWQELKAKSKASTSLAWGRVFFPFGPGEKDTRVIPLMIRALLKDQPVALSSGWQKRDFLFTEDLGDLIAGLALSAAEGDFNLSSGEGHSLREMGQQLARLTKKPGDLLRFSNDPLKEPALIVGSTQKRQSIFPWKAKHSLAQGLEKTLNWWVNHREK